MTTPIAPPVVEADTFADFLLDTTPGGPVVLQLLVTIIVASLVLFRSPPTPAGVVFSAVVLMMTPWVPSRRHESLTSNRNVRPLRYGRVPPLGIVAEVYRVI